MANPIDIVISKEALAEIDKAISKVGALDKEIQSTAQSFISNSKKMASALSSITPVDVSESIADNSKLTAELDRQSKVIQGLETQIKKLSQVRATNNKMSAEEAVNQRILNKNALDQAKAVSSLVGAKVDSWKASNAGSNNRAYLDSAFPELNPWEKAGASATSAGVGLEGVNTGSDQQTRELATRVGMQDQQIAFGKEQLAAQERMNATSAAAGVQSASIGVGPAWASNPALVAKMEAERMASEASYWRQNAETTSIQDRNRQSWIENIPRILMSGFSTDPTVAGHGASGFKGDALKSKVAGDVYGGVGSLVSGGGAGKIGSWMKKFWGSKASPPGPKVEPPMSSGSVLE